LRLGEHTAAAPPWRCSNKVGEALVPASSAATVAAMKFAFMIVVLSGWELD